MRRSDSSPAILRPTSISGTYGQQTGKPTEAIAHFREAIRLKPNATPRLTPTSVVRYRTRESMTRPSLSSVRRSGSSHANFGSTSTSGTHWNGWESSTKRSPSFREAIRLEPDDAETHICLGRALSAQGKAGRIPRRMPRGGPARSPIMQTPSSPWAPHWIERGSWMKQSPGIARRSGSNPGMPWLT